jgi:hypothetical protein
MSLTNCRCFPHTYLAARLPVYTPSYHPLTHSHTHPHTHAHTHPHTPLPTDSCTWMHLLHHISVGYTRTLTMINWTSTAVANFSQLPLPVIGEAGIARSLHGSTRGKGVQTRVQLPAHSLTTIFATGRSATRRRKRSSALREEEGEQQ